MLESDAKKAYPPCPNCGGESARIVYGLPDPSALEEGSDFRKRIDAGEITLGGCVVEAEKWFCRECKCRWTP